MKFDVPDQAMVQSLENLQNSLSANTNVKDSGSEIAYALYVLARNKRASISDLRYYADTLIGEFKTPLAKAQIAAALSLYGDAQRARTSSSMRFRRRSNRRPSLPASPATTTAHPCAMALPSWRWHREQPGSAHRAGTCRHRLQGLADAPLYQHTGTGLDAAGRPRASEWRRRSDAGRQWCGPEGAYMATTTGEALVSHPVTVTNTSKDALSVNVTTVAAPAQPLPAGGDGFTIERHYYTLAVKR